MRRRKNSSDPYYPYLKHRLRIMLGFVRMRIKPLIFLQCVGLVRPRVIERELGKVCVCVCACALVPVQERERERERE